MEISGWSKERLSDLLDVSYPAFIKWLSGESEPAEDHAKLIDKLYILVTESFEEAKREYFESLEKRLLRRQVRQLDKNNPKKKYL
jgi:transcriptional regulator with XRE-family HTH domain